VTNPNVVPRLDLGGGTSVEADGTTVELAGGPVPVLLVRLPLDRAHRLAHSLVGQPAPDFVPTDRTLARGLEAVAAAAGDLGALRCAAAELGVVVGQPQRVAAVAVLRDRDPALTAVQRIAVIDAAARWMEEDAGDELALALLTAACSSPVVANLAYVELLSPAAGSE
jgi:hypothetical protein